MKDSKQKRDTWVSEFKTSIIEVLRNNGTLFTVFAVSLILISGVAIIDNPSNWWLSAVSVGLFFITVFLFLNARVILKSFFSVVITILLAAYSFNVGSTVDITGPGAIVWLLATVFLFFTTLSLSYILISGKSRWGTIILTQFIFFCITFVLSVSFNHVELAVAISLLASLLLFVVSYRFTKASRASFKHFPKNVATEDFVSKIEVAAGNMNRSFIDLRDPETDRGGVIIWDKKAFLLYPVELLSAFTPMGRKMSKLGYRDKSINSWLMNIALKEAPVWQSRGAEIIPVLVDLNNKNGHEAKTIGVSLPDTKKKLPVGVFPGKIFNEDNAFKISKALENIEKEYSQYASDLNDKQKKALSRMSEIDED